MRIKNMMATALFMIAGQAYGHGFDLEGSHKSVAQLVTEALLRAAVENPSIQTERLECEGTCLQVRNEDDFGYIECTAVVDDAGADYQCFTAEKHGKPLRPKDGYRRGNYMNFEGGPLSNATHLFAMLNGLAESGVDELITVREINENRRVITRSADAQGETFTCTQDLSSGKPQTECRIQR